MTYPLRRPVRRTLIAGAMITTGALALAGCAGGGGDDVSEDGTVTLTYRTWIPSLQQWEPIIEAFEAEHPDINIEFQGADGASNYLGELDNLILAGDVPDLYGIQVGSAFDDYAEYALPTEDYAADWISQVKPELLESTTTSDGVVSALPILTAGSEFFLYNQTLVEELGLTLPTDHDSLLAFSEAANAAGVTPFAMGAADAWHASDFFVWLSNQYGGGGDIYEAAAGEIPWDSENLIAAAEMWQSLFDDGVFQEAATSTTTYPSARDDYFMARRAAAMPTGSWHVSATLSGNSETPGSAVENDVLGMLPFPTLGDADAGSVTGVDYALALSYELEGEKLEAAATFAEFLAVGEGQQIWVDMLQGFPAAADVTVELASDETATAIESVDAVTEALQSAEWPRKLTSENEGLETDLGIVLQNIANGADPESELATLN
jgi:raffinose/stachyose/melibiose transport system substrate-binding protein